MHAGHSGPQQVDCAVEGKHLRKGTTTDSMDDASNREVHGCSFIEIGAGLASASKFSRCTVSLSLLLFKVFMLMCCSESADSLGVRIQLNLPQHEPVFFSIPFLVSVTAHCRLQCHSCTPCEKCKSHQA